jgi:hypothetical protein
MRPYLKKAHNERLGGVIQHVGPEFKPQYHKKKKVLDTEVYFLNVVLQKKMTLRK